MAEETMMAGKEFRMKKKLGWILGIGIGVVLFVIGWRQINGSGGGDSTRQYTPVTNEFYYNQLTDVEKTVCQQIEQQVHTLQGGYVALDQPISHMNFSRIELTLNYDETHRDWAMADMYPVKADHSYADAIAVEYCDETTEPDIVGIYVQIITEDDSDVLDYPMNFWEENNIQVDEDAFLPQITSTGMTQETYEQIQKELNQVKTDIIAKIPEGADQREIIRFLSKWIQINLAYNDDFRSELETGTVRMEALQKYRIRSSEQCLLDKKAICGGRATVLSELCNQVGIESHVVAGIVEMDGDKVGHAWVAVRIDGKTYYTDPTNDIFGQMYSGLYTREELANLGKTMGLNYIFEDYFAE